MDESDILRLVDTVVDDADTERLVLALDGAEAEMEYRTVGGRMVITHTGVPDELGGRGLGGVLVRRAVRKALAEDLTIAPWCPFARRWLEQHPDDVGGVAIDWTPPPSS